jgi:uncharacterized protein (DUF488 family)
MPVQPDENARPTLFTIGHSTHPIEMFLGLLAQHRIELLADVRSFPSSRRWPQFNQDELKASLERGVIRYEWLKLLGGRRSSKRADSPHSAWRHPAFRSYADYTESSDFAAGLNLLLEFLATGRTALMCSEGLWWRCHRRIVADHVTLRGVEVQHIKPDGRLTRHSLSDFASVRDGRIVYDGGQSGLELK